MHNSKSKAGSSRIRTGLAAVAGLLATVSGAPLLLAEPAEVPAAAGAARAATLHPKPTLVLSGLEIPGRWALGVPADSTVADNQRVAIRTSFVVTPGSLRPALAVQIPEQLVGRMAREARRLQQGALPAAWSRIGPEDSLSEAELSRQAEKVIKRSFRRSLDERLRSIAATTPGLGPTLAWVGGLGLTPRSHRSGEARRLADGEPGAIDQARFSGSARLRIDAHPRIQLGAEYLRFRGRIDLPLLSGDPLRLSLDRAITPRTAASLSGGTERNGRGWAALGFTLAF